MPSLPPAIVPLLSPFASLFDARTWRKVQILLTGVILAPGRRTVSTALYVLGLHARGDFALFHHVLSRAAWSSPGRPPGTAGPTGPTPGSDGTAAAGHRRDPGTALGGEDRGPGGVPGPGALLPRPLRQGQGIALGQPDAAGRDPLGQPGAGPALPDRAGPVRALLRGPRPPPQDDHGLGAPDAVPSASLAPRLGAGGRRGPHLRHPEAAGHLPGPETTHHLPDPAAPGCGPP